MKNLNRRVVVSFFVCILTLMLFISSAYASSPKNIDIQINGDSLCIPPSFGSPFYDANGRLQIPMRYIFESCGYDVDWNSSAKAATVKTTKGDLVITLGSKMLKTPNGPVQMDTSAMLKDGRTYIPLRFALEALDFTVTWETGSKTDIVSITGKIGGNSNRKTLSSTEVAASASPAVFYIEVADVNSEPIASGSGFFIDPSGIGVTNYHVIDGASYAGISMPDGKIYYIGDILYYNIERDIVVFRAYDFNDAGELFQLKDQPYLNMALASSVQNGNVAYAIGSPLGLQNTITNGLVSNKDRLLNGSTELKYIQTSAPISSGNSGGPLLNEYAQVIGINTATIVAGQNLNLAVPISAVGAANMTQSSYPTVSDVCSTTFEAMLATSNLDVADRIVYEEDTVSQFPQQQILNGDTMIGTFAQYNSMDYYWFYTPIEVNVNILTGGLDIASESEEFNQYELGAFYMTLDLGVGGDTYMKSTKFIDGGGNPVYEISTTLQPGYYYICTLQAINDSRAWRDRNYFVYLSMTPTK